MNIYLERLAITIYIIVIIALVGLGTIIIKCLQLAENKEFLRIIFRGYCRNNKTVQQMDNGQSNV